MDGDNNDGNEANGQRQLEERRQRLATRNQPHLAGLLERQLEQPPPPPPQLPQPGRDRNDPLLNLIRGLRGPPVLQRQRQQRRRPTPVQRRRVDRDPSESLQTRRRAMEIMNADLQEMSQICVRVLRQQQPLVESRIQSLLEEQERLAAREDHNPPPAEDERDEEEEEEGEIAGPTKAEQAERLEMELAVAFAQTQQIPEDIATLRPIYSDPENHVSPGQLRTLFRVFESAYFDMQSNIAELEEMQEEEEEDEEEQVVNVDAGFGMMMGAMGAMANADAGIGLAAALLGVASGMIPPMGAGGAGNGMSPEMMQQFVQRLGLPADFFADVPVPMREDTLQTMPSTAYKDTKHPEGKSLNEECNICMLAFQPDDMVRMFPCCNVVQHTDCLVQWFTRHDNCVVCRAKVSDTLRARTPPREGEETE